jgi:PAS domain S-box-containing protein
MLGAADLGSRLDLLLRLVESTTASPDLEHVLDRVVKSAVSLAEDSHASLWLVRGSRLLKRAHAGRHLSIMTSRTELAIGEGVIGRAALQRQTLVIPDVQADERHACREYYRAEKLVASAATPLVAHGRLVGVLVLATRCAGALGDGEIEMLTAFAGHAAIAIESARAYADTERRRREAAALADVAHDLAEHRDLDTVLARIVQGASELCGGDITSVALRDADGVFSVRHVVGCRSDVYRRYRTVPGLGIGGRAVLSGRPARAAERGAWPPMPAEYAAAIDAEGIQSALAVPIIVSGTVEGVLYVCSRTPGSFTDADETMLLRLADHAATAIHTSRHFAAEWAARAQAQRLAESFRDLVDTLDAIVVEADAETFHITFVNERAEAILGYPREAWLTDPSFLVNRMHPDDRDRAVTHCSMATAQGRDHAMEYRLLAADGRVLWVHDLVRVLPAEAGRRRQLRSVIVDISARKQAELELQEQRQLLTHLTRVATLGELSGALAHELNQPLTSILNNAQAGLRLLDRGLVDVAEFRDILRDIADEDRRAGEVIRRLRTLLRRGEMPRQPLDVNDVARDVLRLAHSELIARGTTVSTQLAPGLPKVLGDRVALQQVLLNLVVNACDAMRQCTPPERELTVATTQDDDGAVRVAIVDRGAGIAPEGMDRIFEPFFTTKEHGLGLGLVICRSIVAAHGGRLGAVNNAGRGATFWFMLPAAS